MEFDLRHNKIQSVCAILLIISLLFSHTVVFAEDVQVAEPPIEVEESNQTIILTGDALAEGDIVNVANENIVDTEAEESNPEGDDAPVEADIEIENGNEGDIQSDMGVGAGTGDNNASSTGDTIIGTGDADAGGDIVNVANTNTVDSEGAIVFAEGEDGNEETLDLREGEFFNENMTNNDPCDEGCIEGDLSVENNNEVTIENNISVEANTGGNTASSTGDAIVVTGDAYAAANVINVANSNIIDSNYLIMTFNNFGDWGGNLILPARNFFERIFGLWGGIGGNTTISNSNTANIENNVSVSSNTGGNNAMADNGEAIIVSGNAVSTASVLNQTNTNIVGGSSFTLTFNVSGDWDGDVFGLPEGFYLSRSPYGLTISNHILERARAERGPGSELSIENQNTANILNNIEVNAATGDNTATSGDVAAVVTGDAYATANVINVANTNVIGANWLLGIFNILGNWEGDISFGMPDLWVGTMAQKDVSYLERGDTVKYYYTIINKGDADATGVRVTALFDKAGKLGLSGSGAFTEAREGEIFWDIGDIPAGGFAEVSYTAQLTGTLPFGETKLFNTVEVTCNEPEENPGDNSDTVDVLAFYSKGSSKWNGASGVSISPFIGVSKTDSSGGGIYPGSSIDYEVLVVNSGGPAYDVLIKDILYSPNGMILSEEIWDLATVSTAEEILISYSMLFSTTTPPGEYVNVAEITGIGGHPKLNQGGYRLEPVIAKNSIFILEEEPEPEPEPVLIEPEPEPEPEAEVEIFEESVESNMPDEIALITEDLPSDSAVMFDPLLFSDGYFKIAKIGPLYYVHDNATATVDKDDKKMKFGDRLMALLAFVGIFFTTLKKKENLVA